MTKSSHHKGNAYFDTNKHTNGTPDTLQQRNGQE